MKRARATRAGFTLWELTMVLLVMAIAATLAAPAYSRLGSEQPTQAADRLIGILRDARKASLTYDATVYLRIDPITMKYQVDTTTAAGSGILAQGVLDLGMTQKLETDLARLQFVFRSTGAAFGDTVVVRGGDVPLVLRVDPWSGVARADTL